MSAPGGGAAGNAARKTAAEVWVEYNKLYDEYTKVCDLYDKLQKEQSDLRKQAMDFKAARNQSNKNSSDYKHFDGAYFIAAEDYEFRRDECLAQQDKKRALESKLDRLLAEARQLEAAEAANAAAKGKAENTRRNRKSRLACRRNRKSRRGTRRH